MTRQQQAKFVKELCANVCEDVVTQIASGKIPEEWDGHELRRLLGDRFEESANLSRFLHDKRSKRYREYETVKLVNNL